MRTMKTFIMLLFGALLFVQCGLNKFEDDANNKIGDQHFKTAIALIELHKVRFGEYPASLDSIKYAGDWDQIVWSSIKYRKLDTGYELDLVKGVLGKPVSLHYPNGFWKGLGLVRSNMKN